MRKSRAVLREALRKEASAQEEHAEKLNAIQLCPLFALFAHGIGLGCRFTVAAAFLNSSRLANSTSWAISPTATHTV